jgi:hypothetical protein
MTALKFNTVKRYGIAAYKATLQPETVNSEKFYRYIIPLSSIRVRPNKSEMRAFL